MRKLLLTLLLITVPWSASGDVLKRGPGGGVGGGGGTVTGVTGDTGGPTTSTTPSLLGGTNANVVCTTAGCTINNEAVASESGAPHLCSSGLIPGGGLDANGKYAWTCGNYNWSAISGGFPTYTSATTAGGNSWVMDCTGDGVANPGGTTPDAIPLEETSCRFAGDQINMYATADIMLAWDHRRKGGKVYLPEGQFHLGGCGQSAPVAGVQTPNNCPVLQFDPTHKQRHVQMFDGAQLVGENVPFYDFEKAGRRTGTILLNDLGRGGDGTQALKDLSETPSACTATTEGCLIRWGTLVGMSGFVRSCQTDDTSGADGGPGSASTCDLHAANESRGWVGFTRYGRSTTQVGTTVATAHNANGVCIGNVVTSGVCGGGISDTALRKRARLIPCTASGARTGLTTGGCGDFGTCEGIATAMESDLAFGDQVLTSIYTSNCHYGGGCAAPIAGLQANWARVTSVGASCESAAGRFVQFKDTFAGANTLWPFAHTSLDPAAGVTVYVVDHENYDNTTGGYANLAFTSANWSGRDSANSAADCLTESETVCDGVEMVSLAGGFYGGLDHISIQYAGGLNGFSSIDGHPQAGWKAHVRDSWGSKLKANIADTVQGAIWERNTWLDSDCESTACFTHGFGDNIRRTEETYIRMIAGSLYAFQTGSGGIVEKLQVFSSTFTGGMFRHDNDGNVTVQNVTGRGNRGSVITISPRNSVTIANVTYRDVKLRGHELQSGAAGQARAIVEVTDYNGNASYATGGLRQIVIDNVQVENVSADGCAVFLDGGFGSDVDDDGAGPHTAISNGSGRNIDDFRNQLFLKNIGLKTTAASPGTPQAFCLGNRTVGSNNGSNRYGDVWTAVGGMPSFENIQVNETKFSDWGGTLPASAIPAATAVPHGLTVRIHDDTAAGACTDANSNALLDGGGTANSTCASNGTIWVSVLAP